MDLFSWWAWAIAILVFGLAISPFRERVRIILLGSSIILFVRYLLWRGTDTLNLDDVPSLVIGIGLLLAELYVLINFCLTGFQLWKPTKHDTPPPVARRKEWPSVDVCITVYNEPVEVLHRTAVGCLAMDYPGRKVIWILDDGHREEIRSLAQELGCNYISRPDNRNAKAGNLNHGLAQMNGELVAVFDVDHIPVKTFLLETAPYLFADERLAFVQTPHHFYNPDPFQRNLAWEQIVSNEQDFFYRVVLPGRDHWNAAFFCGSSALFRRSALDDIGGFRTETVTEDIHTSITLHAKGWHSIVHDRALAAGLAPESLRDFVRQRHRWAKGTLEMARVDNPLTMKGLSAAQRLNYFGSVWFFLFPLARLFFLIAPLSFLLADVRPLETTFDAMVNNYGPYLIAMMVAFPVVCKRYRGLVESDLVEFAAAFALLPAIGSGLLGKRAGVFHVTPKDQKVEKPRWDTVGLPHAVVFFVSIVAISWAWLRGAAGSQDMLAINTVWASYNALLMLVIAVTAYQRPQLRSFIRFRRAFSVSIKNVRGFWHGNSLDVGESGIRVVLDSEEVPDSPFFVTIDGAGSRLTAKGSVVWAEPDEENGTRVGIKFSRLSKEQARALIRLIVADPDSWEAEANPPSREVPKLPFLLLAPAMLLRQEETRKRHQIRLPRRLPVSLLVGTHRYNGHVLDIGRNGVKIRCRGHIPDLDAGDDLQFGIQKGSAGLLRGQVRWLRRRWPNTELGLYISEPETLDVFSLSSVRPTAHIDATATALQTQN